MCGISTATDCDDKPYCHLNTSKFDIDSLVEDCLDRIIADEKTNLYTICRSNYTVSSSYHTMIFTKCVAHMYMHVYK